MSYRSNKQNRLRWKRFVAVYKERLMALGISELVFRSEDSWYYFIEHDVDHEYPELLNLTTWKLDDLKPLLPLFEEMDHAGHYVGDGSGVLFLLRSSLNPEIDEIDDTGRD